MAKQKKNAKPVREKTAKEIEVRDLGPRKGEDVKGGFIDSKHVRGHDIVI